MTVLIKNVRLYGAGEPVDLLLADGTIQDIGTGLASAPGSTRRTAPRTAPR